MTSSTNANNMTSYKHVHHPLHPITSSPHPPANHSLQNDHLTLGMKNLPRIIIAKPQTHHQRLFCIRLMAEKASKNNETELNKTTTDEGKKEEEQDKKTDLPPPPPPPEKPLPGDCCGSGCVRCVWDMYYEELEEYNRMYNCNSNSGSQG